jgi:hypothetical protein
MRLGLVVASVGVKNAQLFEVASVGHHGGELFEGIELVHALTSLNSRGLSQCMKHRMSQGMIQRQRP